MVLLPPAPQAGASASSATSAWPCRLEGVRDVRLRPDATYYCVGAGGGVVGAVFAGAGVVGAGAGFAAGAGADVPLTTDPVPRCPMIESVNANSMNSTAAIDVALVSSVAPDRAPNAA